MVTFMKVCSHLPSQMLITSANQDQELENSAEIHKLVSIVS